MTSRDDPKAGPEPLARPTPYRSGLEGLADLPPRLRTAVLLARRQREAMIRAATRRIIFATLRAGHRSRP